MADQERHRGWGLREQGRLLPGGQSESQLLWLADSKQICYPMSPSVLICNTGANPEDEKRTHGSTEHRAQLIDTKKAMGKSVSPRWVRCNHRLQVAACQTWEVKLGKGEIDPSGVVVKLVRSEEGSSEERRSLSKGMAAPRNPAGGRGRDGRGVIHMLLPSPALPSHPGHRVDNLKAVTVINT